jgi:hypothetical protein
VEAVPLTPAAAPSRHPGARVLKAGWARQPGKRTQGVQDWWVHRFVLLRSDAQHGAVLEVHREADGGGAPYALALSAAAAEISRCIDWTGRAVPQTPLLASAGTFEVEVSGGERLLLEVRDAAEKEAWLAAVARASGDARARAAADGDAFAEQLGFEAEGCFDETVRVGSYPTVTLQYRSTTSYQVSYHIR